MAVASCDDVATRLVGAGAAICTDGQHYAERDHQRECIALLNVWQPLDQPLLAIELLGAEFVDTVTRQWAVTQLERIDSDDELLSVMLALVQALKCELFHYNALTRFLLRRAMHSARVGQRLYWLLNTKIERDVTHATRFGLDTRGVPTC